ncbi:MAG TPA: glycosyltransferase [Candidatus Competibacteraceae bacterium]|nr:glycosyltransferase [Candidatus Competibacteraceae bacterium]
MPGFTASPITSPNTTVSASQSRPRGGATTSLKPAIAFLLLDLQGGGVQKMVSLVAGALARRGYPVTLLLYNAQGPLQEQLPAADIRLVELKAVPGWLARLYALAADPAGFKALLGPIILPRRTFKTLPYLPDLARYLQRERPAVLFAATPDINIEAILARQLAATSTRIVISERTHASRLIALSPSDWRLRFLPGLMRRTYRQADAIVAVSNGVANDLASIADLPRSRITTIYNPTVQPDLPLKAQAPLEHPWFTADAPPIILSVGRLSKQKAFDTLLKAFARLRAERPVRLLILGDADSQSKRNRLNAQLLGLAAELGVADDVRLEGFIANPFAYMARAAVFVLSSRFEGFPNVLVEALACGCPVVSTHCPSGPAEILDHGRFGPLVPVGDDLAMAEAIAAVLDRPLAKEQLRARAAMFSFEQAIDRYEAILLGKKRLIQSVSSGST